jgi:predicted ATPase
MSRYVITGGPGAGKSSLLAALQQLGYHCCEEVSRQLIMEALENDQACLPWVNLACFAERALHRMEEAFHAVSGKDLAFFDRGIPDIMAYLHAAALPLPDKYLVSAMQHPYHTTIFLLPPWEGIYVQDRARWQSFKEAETIYQHITETYQSLGYQLKILPKGTIAQRVKFVLDQVAVDNLNHIKIASEI